MLAVLKVGPQSLNLLPAIAVIGATGRWWLIVPLMLLFLAIGAVVAWLKWFRFTWRVDEDSISIESGIISRNSRDVPFDRIQDVAIEQGLLARVLGLATVGFDTGSADADGRDEGRLAGITMSDACALRDHIRQRRAASETASVLPDIARPSLASSDAIGAMVPKAATLFAMGPQRLLLAGVFNFSLAIFAILFGLLNSFDHFLPFDPFEVDVWLALGRSVGLEQWVMGNNWLAALGGTLTIVLLGLATGVVRTVAKEWNFDLERTDRGFRRSRGLTTRTDVTLPLARIQAAVVESGIIRRWFGWFSLKLQSLANDGKDDSDHVIAPFARLGEVDCLLAEMDMDRGGFGDEVSKDQWQQGHPIAIFFGPGIMLAIALTGALLLSVLRPDLVWLTGIGAMLALLSLLPAWLAWRYRRWHCDGRLLHITGGFFSRQHIILPIKNIQSLDVSVGPVARQFELARLSFGVAGGGGEHVITDIPYSTAIRLRSHLLAQGAPR
ncbi:PH domain-containing protein [Sphingomonas lacunae]|uniref:PH domain-containing protein n=1 Tax=Sphingomonas lacunae TaxID=2698828 RepID=A0A6M4ASE0_9SPHN|nr:PH domain-containing protein [Sphingomonas lacunae]QJQ31616.1 PH domain-containing protein [Sphingomonas lacunae]